MFCRLDDKMEAADKAQEMLIMLNDNLSRIRRERGLTHEALATRLNVVRQTVSKWENGTAVPDADMLCRIADALDASAAELLGSPAPRDGMDMAAIAKSPAEINAQPASRSKRSGAALKLIPGAAIGLLLLIALALALHACTGIETDAAEQAVAAEASSGAAIELDENEIPLLQRIDKENEHALQEFWGSRNISRAQIMKSWGAPAAENKGSASWPIGEDRVITVFFTDFHYARDCSIESR